MAQTLGRLVAQLEALSAGSVSIEQFGEISSTLAASVDELAPFMRFEPETYSRTEIFRNSTLELLCLGWESGHQSAIHGHGPSIGVVYIVRGVLTEEQYRTLDGPPVEIDVWSEGQRLLSRPGQIHRLANRQPAGRRTVSLHLYAPPLARPALPSGRAT